MNFSIKLLSGEKITYPLDTNIILKGLLEQERSEEVRILFEKFSLEKLFLSDIALYSIGIILFRLNKKDQFDIFLESVINRGMEVISIDKNKLSDIKNISDKFQLDFEDSYQLLLSRLNHLQLISFDKDFDKIEKLRKEPKDILK